MTKPLTVKRIERSRRWLKWFPWLYIVMGGLSLIGALRSGEVIIVLILSAALYLVLGLSGWGYLRWIGSARRSMAAPSPVLADGEVLLWRDDVNDKEARFARRGGLTLTNRRLAFEPEVDRFDPAVGREWPIEQLRSVHILPFAVSDGEINSSTLVFDVGDGVAQRFDVFNPEAALATITTKLEELRSARS